MIENPIILLVVFPLVGYLIGSTPFGVLLARSKGINLRQVGSGNVGATNVSRALGKRWGYFCFVLDVLKGFVPVMLAGMLVNTGEGLPTLLQQAGWLAAGLGAILGHVFSFYLRFHGGKGASTALGVVLGVFPYFTLPGLVAFGIWIVVTLISRYVSFGSVAASLAFLPLFVGFNRSDVKNLLPLLVFAVVMVLLILIRHRTNIRRLLDGTESKIGSKKPEGEQAKS